MLRRRRRGVYQRAIQTKKLGPLRACLGRFPDDVSVQVERGVAVSAETVADLRSLSALPLGLILVLHEVEPRFNVLRVERAW
jgi:hypothetical protein